MTPADLARANAITFEAKKDSLRQTQDGTWKIAFTVQGIDMDERLTKAFPGTRYVAVLVEVGSDELPVSGAATSAAGRSTAIESERSNETKGGRYALTPNALSPVKEASQDEPEPEKPRRDWRDLQPAQQAGIRCNEMTFIAFLKEQYPDDWHEAQEVAECVRLICNVESRTELNTKHRATVLWHQLDSTYQAWKLVSA